MFHQTNQTPAGSSIKYPVQFIDSIRKVILKGEAYFEVAKNPKKPFVVNASNVDIRVIGTAFNVMAYDDEEMIETTLAEGKVVIEAINVTNLSKVELESGYQASFSKQDRKIEKTETPGMERREMAAVGASDPFMSDDDFSDF